MSTNINNIKFNTFPSVNLRSGNSVNLDKKIGNLNKGKSLSKETIEKMRESALNRDPMSDETKLKCIANTRAVTLYNLNDTVYGKYSTIKEAASAINCNEKTIRRALKTEKKLVKRQ